MSTKPGPEWSDSALAEGQRQKEAWEDFFSAREQGQRASEDVAAEFKASAELSAVRTRHERKLLSYANVVGIAEGIQTRGGKPTGKPCLVVYVREKISPENLSRDELLPETVDGIPVDVVEVGEIGTLPA